MKIIINIILHIKHLRITGSTPITAGEYRTAMRYILGYFNILNSTNITNATDVQLPCAANPPPAAEI